MTVAWRGLGLIGLGVGAFWSGVAQAGDKPVVAPPESWVNEVPVPEDKAPADQAAVRVLLMDRQAHFDREKGNAIYARTVTRLQTAQGLAAFGTMAFPWRPDSGGLTIHRIRVIRDGKIIDLISKPEDFTIIRREQNLERSTLDGQLTATFQAVGLQVGDIIDMATTVIERDPTLRGHGDQFFGGWPAMPIGRLRVSASWGAGQPVRWKATDLPAPLKQASATTIGFDATEVAPFILPEGAPPRFRYGRQLQVSDFASWAEVSALFAPLYDKARKLAPDSPLRAEIERIKAASMDPKVRAAAALDLVETKVRYVYIGLGDGNLVPADADLTWQRRYGDCKGKTALLLALLDGLGIEAEPALVSTVVGDGLPDRLPTLSLFNHVFVRAKVAGTLYWLDGTRLGDRGIDDIPVFPFRWALPVRASGSMLEPLIQKPFEKPDSETIITLDASKGLLLPAPARVEQVIRGDEAIATSQALANLAPADLDRFLRDFWRTQYDFITPTKVTASYDPKTGEERLVLEGTAKMEWDGGRYRNGYELDGAGLGWKADFTREGPYASAPFAVDFPSFTRMEENILLPRGGRGFSVGKVNVDKILAGRHYYRHVAVEGATMKMIASTRSLQDEFPASEAKSAAAELRAMADVGVYLFPPSDYVASADETAAIQASPPLTDDDAIRKANSLWGEGKVKEANAEIEAILAKQPDSISALMLRSAVNWWLDKPDAAKADVEHVLKLDSTNSLALATLTSMTLEKSGAAAAFVDASRAVEKRPDDPQMRIMRARVARQAKLDDMALADASAAIAQDPALDEAYLLRANIFQARGDKPKVTAEAEALVRANPKAVEPLVTAATIFCRNGQMKDALRTFDQALALDDDRAFVLLNRGTCRRDSDAKAAMADVDAAIAADPSYFGAYRQKVDWLSAAGDYKAVVKTWDEYANGGPIVPAVSVERAFALAKSGDIEKARAAFAEARAKAGENAVILNQICWNEATVGIDLTQALDDCRASVAIRPMAMNQDSLGFVLLALGKYEESVASYDKALALRPDQAESLFGRALARQRGKLGDHGQADFKAAVSQNAEIEKTFKDYGQLR